MRIIPPGYEDGSGVSPGARTRASNGTSVVRELQAERGARVSENGKGMEGKREGNLVAWTLPKNGAQGSFPLLGSRRRSEGKGVQGEGNILGRGRRVKRRERVKACEWSLRAVAHGVVRANGARGRARRPRGARVLPEVEEAHAWWGPLAATARRVRCV